MKRGVCQLSLVCGALLLGAGAAWGQVVGGRPFHEFKVVTATGNPVPLPVFNEYVVSVLPEMGLDDSGRLSVSVLTDSNSIPLIYERPLDGLTESIRPDAYLGYPVSSSRNNSGKMATLYWQPSSPPRGSIVSFVQIIDLDLPLAQPIDLYLTETGFTPTRKHMVDFFHPTLSEDGHVGVMARQMFDMWTPDYGSTNWAVRLTPGAPAIDGCTYCRKADWVQILGKYGPPESSTAQHYPVVAEGGVIGVMSGQTNNGDILRIPLSSAPEVVASAPGDFETLGPRVGMSDDGKVMAFYGTTNGVQGLYLSFFDGSFSPPAPQLVLDTNFKFAVNASGGSISFAGFDLTEPLFVEVQDRNDDDQLIASGQVEGDSVLVAFMATPSEASVLNLSTGDPLMFRATRGIWVARFDILRGLVNTTIKEVVFRNLMPVIQEGDLIEGTEITSLWLTGMGRALRQADLGMRRTSHGRPEQGDHVLAFHAKNSFGDDYAVKAYHLDTDADGLPDHWERPGGGIDMDGDGTVELSLAEMLASDDQKDVFVELDWTGPRPGSSYPGGWINAPTLEEITKLWETFLFAPVTNANGSEGIRLHVDAGPGLSFGMEGAESLLQGGDIVLTAGSQRPDMMLITPDENLLEEESYGAVRVMTVDAAKKHYFSTGDKRARELAFRYGVLADFGAFNALAGGTGKGQVVFEVVSATRRELIVKADPLQPMPAAALDNVTDISALMVVDGSAAGASRRVDVFAPVGGINGDPWQFRLTLVEDDPGFTTIPAAGDTVVLALSIGGNSELDFVESPSGLDHRRPGNEFVITKGAWTLRADRHCASSLSVGRTMVHELGHTLGLAHGGRSPDCTHDGLNHFSVMSYSHEQRVTSFDLIDVYSNGCGSTVIPFNWTTFPPILLSTVGNPVESYSWGLDPLGFNEWAYLRMEPWGTPWFVGNAMMRRDGPLPLVHPRNVPFPGPPDLAEREGPRIFLQPIASRTASTGAVFTATFGAQDQTGVGRIDVRFDVNGDGFVNATNELVAATLVVSGEYQAVFGSVSGTSTLRMLQIHAMDVLGNDTFRPALYRIGGGPSADTQAPTIYQADSSPQLSPPGDPTGVRVYVYEESAAPLGGVGLVEFLFDVNGDGVTNEALETATGGLDVDGYWRCTFPTPSGPPGLRRLRVIAEDVAGNRSTNTDIQIRVLAPDTTNPVIIAITPTNGAVVPFNPTGIAVIVRASDESWIKSVSGGFDADGDGIITGYYELASFNYGQGETSVTSVLALASAGIGGNEGPRTIHVSVEDGIGNRTTQTVTVVIQDTASPTLIVTSPMFDQMIRPGTNFEVTGSAADDQRVTNVIVRVDLDGDGSFGGVGEVVVLGTNSPSSFAAAFAGFTGAAGERRVQVEAWDPAGRSSAYEYFVHAAPGLRAWAPLAGDRVSVGSSVLVAIEAPLAGSIVMALDLNGDGDRLDPGESVTGVVRTIAVQAIEYTRVTEAVLGTVEGPAGLRDLVVTGVETSGAALNLVIPLIVTNDAIFATARSQRVGGVPVHADPVTKVGWSESLTPDLLLPFGSNLLFTATTPDEGRTLWISDGTKTGTRMLKNSNPYRFTSGGAPVGMGINALAPFQNRVYFNATDQEGGTFSGITGFGNELWVTDGTTGGTYMLKDINPGNTSSTDSGPASFTEFGGKLYFTASHVTLGRELWRTDGTATGTVLFADLTPTQVGSGPGQLVPMGGRLWFLVSNLALWSTDGTATGTVHAFDLPSLGIIAAYTLAATDTRLFLECVDGTNGRELWSSDGTATSLVMLANIAPGSASSFPQAMIAFSNRIWFTAANTELGRELWSSDGTPAGTQLVRDFMPGWPSGLPRNFTVHDGRLWFSVNDPTSGEEVWSTDGTPAGLRRESEIGRASGPSVTPANANLPSASPTNFCFFGSNLYLQASDYSAGRNGYEFWRLGTGGAARIVRDLAPLHVRRNLGIYGFFEGPDSSLPSSIRSAGNRLFLGATDSLYGNQLHISDATATGTLRLGGRVRPAGLPEMIRWNGNPLYAARNGKGGRWIALTNGQFTGHALALPTGTTSPSNIVASANGLAFEATLPPDELGQIRQGVFAVASPGAPPVLLQQLNDCWRIFPAGNGWLFTGRDTNNVDRLWSTDGTAPGTLPITNIASIYGTGYPADFVQIGTQTLFNMSVTAQGEVWISDGTVSGTRRVLTHGTGEMLRYSELFVTNGTRIGLFATADDLTMRFWVLPAINSNALPVAELTALPGYPAATETRAAIVNNRWILSAASPYTNLPLWSTDGTSTGTYGFGLANYPPYGGDVPVVSPRRLKAIGNNLYFLATHGYDGEEPFVSDCTTNGTRSLGNLYSIIYPGANPGSFPRNFTPLGSWVLFTATDRLRGEELWRTDGTAEGTIFLKDIHPGLPSSEIADLLVHSNRIFFTARTAELGRELWSTDGTTQGTQPVEDLMPGPGSSDPKMIFAQTTNLIFFALDGSEDPSLRTLNPAALPPTPYQQWLATYSPPGSFPAAPWLDGDGDDWNNEMEYLFDSSPTDPAQRHPVRAVATLTTNTLNYITLTYRRPADWSALGLWFTYEGGYFMDYFSTVPVDTVSIVPTGAFEIVTVRRWVESTFYPTYFLSLRIRRD